MRPKKLINSLEPDFPSLADEIAEPRPDMNIKVAAFTVSEKSINTFYAPAMRVFRKFCHRGSKSDTGSFLYLMR